MSKTADLGEGISRRKMLIGTGAIGASGVLLAACGDDDNEPTPTETTPEPDAGNEPAGIEQFGKGDLGIVNYALTLEYLEADFYDQVAKSGLFKGSDLKLIKSFGQNEAEHVVALEDAAKALGTPAPKPKFEFPLDDATEVLKLAATVENLGAAAYLGQAGAIKDKAILSAALSIHTVEARHAAVLNTMLGDSFVPDGPFAEPADFATVLDSVTPFIVA